MRRALPLLLIAVALAGCKAKPAENATAEESGQPQVATSIEDYNLPVDKSDQITSIDAATGDAAGMPKDGGAVVQAPKREPEAPKPDEEAANVQVAAPVAAPAPAVEAVPGTN